MSTFDQIQQEAAAQFAEQTWAAANGARQWADLDSVVGHLAHQTKIDRTTIYAAATTPDARIARIGQGPRAAYKLLGAEDEVPDGAEVISLGEQLGEGMRRRALARASYTARSGISTDLPPDAPIAAQRLDVVKAREMVAQAEAEVAKAVPAALDAELAKVGADENTRKLAVEAFKSGDQEKLDLILTRRRVVLHPSGRGSIAVVETKPFDPDTWSRPEGELPRGTSFSTARSLLGKARLFAEARTFGFEIPIGDDFGMEG